MTASDRADRVDLNGLLAALPAGCPRRGRGWCAAAAGVLEATAPKPGNVHPGAAFDDLAHADFVAAAVAIAPAMEAAADRPLGHTVLAAVTAAVAVTPSNANLGIVLAIAPLAAADVPAAADISCDTAAVEGVLAALSPRDAADVWRAIGLARPGGLGTSDRWDLAGPPPSDLRAAMRHAAEGPTRDSIAALWAGGYASLAAGLVADIATELDRGRNLLEAIVRGHVRQLARTPDTLIARRHGVATAAEVSRRAAALLLEPDDAWEAAVAEFDRSLRSPRRLNPGTTADLVAAALYILLRSDRLDPWLSDG